MKILYTLEIGFFGCGDSGYLEYPDDTPEDLIERDVNELALEWASSWQGDTRLYSEDEWDEMGEEAFEFYEGAYGTWEVVDG